MKPVAIYGCGGHGRVIADACAAAGLAVRGFLDDGLSAEDGSRPVVDDLPVLGGQALLGDAVFLAANRIVVGIGDAAIRRRLALKVLAQGGELATVIHPASCLARRTRIGRGSVVMAGAVINTGTTIGDFAVVNTRAAIDHDNVIHDGVQVGPGAILAGRVQVHEDAFIGTGACVLPDVVIGRNVMVAAGAAVIGDVPENMMVAGVPARPKHRWQAEQ